MNQNTTNDVEEKEESVVSLWTVGSQDPSTDWCIELNSQYEEIEKLFSPFLCLHCDTDDKWFCVCSKTYQEE